MHHRPGRRAHRAAKILKITALNEEPRGSIGQHRIDARPIRHECVRLRRINLDIHQRLDTTDSDAFASLADKGISCFEDGVIQRLDLVCRVRRTGCRRRWIEPILAGLSAAIRATAGGDDARQCQHEPAKGQNAAHLTTSSPKKVSLARDISPPDRCWSTCRTGKSGARPPPPSSVLRYTSHNSRTRG